MKNNEDGPTLTTWLLELRTGQQAITEILFWLQLSQALAILLALAAIPYLINPSLIPGRLALSVAASGAGTCLFAIGKAALHYRQLRNPKRS